MKNTIYNIIIAILMIILIYNTFFKKPTTVIIDKCNTEKQIEV